MLARALARRFVRRIAPIAAIVAATVAVLVPLVPPTAAAATSEHRSADDLPLLKSQDEQPKEREKPRDDGQGRGDGKTPVPAGAKKPKHHRTGFDAKRSKMDASRTTPDRAVYENPDGTETMAVSDGPVRFKDRKGAWRDIDLTLERGSDGRLHAKSRERDASVSDDTTGDLAVVDTDAGEFRFRLAGTTRDAAAVEGRQARYDDVLPGGRDVEVALTRDGFEDTVVLPSAGAGSTWRVELTLPPGVEARVAMVPGGPGKPQEPDGVELVDAKGVVVGAYGQGRASDAEGAEIPVTSTLVGQDGSTVTIENSLPQGWLDVDSRAFPVKADPYATFDSYPAPSPGCPSSPTVNPYNSCDLYANSDSPSSSYYSGTELRTGSPGFCEPGYPYTGPCSGHENRTATFIQFPTGVYGSSPADSYTVIASSLDMHVSGGYAAYGYTQLYANASPPWTGTNWNNLVYPDTTQGSQNPDDQGVISQSNFCGCAGTTAQWIGLESMVQNWFEYYASGKPNMGITLLPPRLSARDHSYFRTYYSSEAGSSLSPMLRITYNRPPVVNLQSPGNGANVATLTPTLSAGISDPDDNPVYSNFVVWEGSTIVWQSGFVQAASVTVPANVLENHHTYNWHVESTDEIDDTTSATWTLNVNNSPPPTPTQTAPADGAVLLPTGVTLTANPVTDPDGEPVKYYFVVTSNRNATGAVVASGPLDTPSFTVPDASLIDGATYSWQVAANDGTSGATPSAPRSFRVDRRMGIKAGLPYDNIGPVSVNLFNGNVVTRSSSPTMGTVSGPLGVSFTYNSQAPDLQGLTGSYYSDCSSPSVPTTNPALVRLDPQLSFDWGTGAPASMVNGQNFCVRWSGYLSGDAGTYKLGLTDDQGARIFVNNQGTPSLDRWSTGPTTTPTFSTSTVNLTRTSHIPITIEYYDNESTPGPSSISLYAKDANNPNDPGHVVPSDWLSPDAPALPAGWSMSSDLEGDATYVSSRPTENGIVLVDATGATHLFTATLSNGVPTGGYTPPSTDPDDVVSKDATGKVTVQRADGTTYTFNADGSLAYVATAADDRKPAAPKYNYGGTPSRLRSITDPVSNRSIYFRYGGDSQCTNTVPTDMLCRIEYWDGTATDLVYTTGATPRLTRIQDPGAEVTDLAYNTDGLLWKIRDPLAADKVAATCPSGSCADDSTMTIIGYDGSKRATSVTLPKAKATDTASPVHRYTYTPGSSRTTMSVDGISGTSRTVDYDATGRVLTDTDATGVASQATWDPGDRPLSSTDATGRITKTIYDPKTFWATDTYGPALASCFNGSVPTTACQNTVPHTHTDHDTGINGLAATYFPNLLLQAATTTSTFAMVHSTGVGRGAVGATSVDPNGALAADWGSAGKPDSSLTAGSWSARYTGDLVPPATGAYQLQLYITGSAKLFVDDALVLDRWSTPSDDFATGAATPPSYSMTNNAVGDRHRITVEYKPGTSGARLELRWTPPGGSQAVVPGTNLAPSYGLVTRTTTFDATAGSPAQVTALGYAAPENGLVTSATQDPDGLALSTTDTYETSDPTQNHYLRRTQHRLPAGNSWTYQYYGADGAQSSRANPCDSGSTAVDQGGAVWKGTSPDPDGTGPAEARIEESVYDAAGRVVATRVGTDPWTCVTYDVRGRTTSKVIPANATEPQRTVTYNYAVGGDPLVASISDPAGTITSTSDLLGRLVSYTDVWGKTTTSTYDLAGRLTDTTGPAAGNSAHWDYDNAGRVTAQKVDGSTVATGAYTNGELTGTTYPTGTGNAGNGTTGTIARDAQTGRTTALTWNQPGGALLTSDGVTYSQAGRVVDESIDGTDAYTTGGNFTYDGAGRLVSAKVPGKSLTWAYDASTPSCTLAPTAGKNTNRTSYNDGTATRSYCYDAADRLVSTTDPAYGSIAYDSHGNTTTLGNQTLGYDGADRHVETKTTTAGSGGSGGGSTTVPVVAASAVSTTMPTSAGVFTENLPTGVAAGDLLVIGISTSGVTATTPSGWTLASTKTQGSSVSYVWWKIATGTEGSSVAITLSTQTQTVGTALRITGADPTAPIDAVGTGGGTSTSPSASVTTTGANELVAGFEGLAAGSATAVTATPPSGWTEQQDAMAQYNYRQGSVATVGQPTAGAVTGTFTTSGSATWTVNLVAIKPAPGSGGSGGTTTTPVVAGSAVSTTQPTSGGVFTVNLPAGTVAGDLLVIGVSASGVTATTPSGWTLGSSKTTGSSASFVWWKVATGSEGSSVAVTLSTQTQSVGTALRITGADPTAPIDAVASAGGTSTSPSATVTTTGTNELVAGFEALAAGTSAAVTATPPAGWTEHQDAMAQFNYRQGSVATVGQPSASAVTGTFTMSSSATWTVNLLAIKPAPASGGTTTTTVRYIRDATDRIVARSVNGTIVAKYSFNGEGDSPSATLDSTGNVSERATALIGDVLLTKRTGGDVWSYPNIHGDVTATTNASGVKQGSTVSYEPFGSLVAGTLPDNAAGNLDYGWLGRHERGFEHEGSVATIEMGARQYVAGLGRFLELDPMPGGSANDYDYCKGDPINCVDLNGMWPHFHMPKVVKKWAHGIATGASVLSVIPGPTSNFFSGVALTGYALSGDWKNAAVAGMSLFLGKTGSYMVKEMRVLREGGFISKGGFQAFRAGVYGGRSIVAGATVDWSFLGSNASGGRRGVSARVCPSYGFGPEMTPGGRC